MKQCANASKCGGCQTIDKEYKETTWQKFRDVCRLYPKKKVNEIIAMDNPYHYRHKVYASFAYDPNIKMIACMYEKNSHRTVKSTDCLIQHTLANAILKKICTLADSLGIMPYNEDSGQGVLRHAYIRVAKQNNDVMLVLVIGSKMLPSSSALCNELRKSFPQIKTIIVNRNSGHTSMILGAKNSVVYGPGYIYDYIDGLKFRISPTSFYQVNPAVAEKLYAIALDMADLKKSDKVLDVCCGIGTVSLLAARKAGYVMGVEINEEAVADAIRNAKNNKIKNAEFLAADARQLVDDLIDTPDVVFLDPPRNGMSEAFMQSLEKLGPKKIVYISCNPETQASDIAFLKNYTIKEIQPVDQFPFTRHVETVCLLSNRKPDTKVRIDVDLEDYYRIKDAKKNQN